MEFDIIIQAIVQAGGYAALCILMLRYLEKETERHRQEVTELSTVIRENTAAITRLGGYIERIGTLGPTPKKPRYKATPTGNIVTTLKTE